MDLRRGKTIKKYSMHITQDSLMSAQYEQEAKKSLSLFGFEFHANVMYSLKKKHRWRLSEMLTKDEYEEEQPIIYSKHQCFEDNHPLLDVYLHDSVSAKEMGYKFVSNKTLVKGFNCESAVNNIKNLNNYTKKERELFEKSKMLGKRGGKKSRKHHKSEKVYIPESNEELPKINDYEMEKTKRANSIRIKEYVQINDLSTFNLVSSYHSMRRHVTKKNVALMKNENKRLLTSMVIEDKDYKSDDEMESEHLSENEEKENKVYSLNYKDCIVNNIQTTKKRRLKKKVRIPTKLFIHEEHLDVVESSSNIDKTVVDLHEDLLPCISIEISIINFLEDLRLVIDFFPCWTSYTSPLMILIDLDEENQSNNKTFIVLMTELSSEDGLVTVKFVFNMEGSKLDFNEVLDQRFEGVKCFLDYIQRQMKENNYTKSSPNRQIIMLDDKCEDFPNLWKIKEYDSRKPLYSFHNEWRSHELNEENFGVFCNIFKNAQGSYVECQVCFSELLADNMIEIIDCGHVICKDCLRCHIVCRLETGMTDMICPGNDCDKMLDIALILSLVKWGRYYKRVEVLESCIISKSGCSCSYCGVLLMDIADHSTGHKRQLQYQCICGRIICSRCSQLQHFPSSCQEQTKYIMKLRDLKDIDIIPVKIQPLVFSGRPCPKCFNFVVKDGGCNHLSCNCGMHFCWGCGDPMNSGRHILSGSFPCIQVSDLVTQDFTKHLAIPNPSSIRPKLYCMALYYKVIKNDYVSRVFNQQLQSILNLDMFSYEKTEVRSHLCELNTVIEHSFVKAYQINKRKQGSLLRYLTCNISLFIFYEQLIQDIVESIHNDVKRLKNKNISKKILNLNFQRLIILSKEVKFHLNRFSKAFQ